MDLGWSQIFHQVIYIFFSQQNALNDQKLFSRSDEKIL